MEAIKSVGKVRVKPALPGVWMPQLYQLHLLDFRKVNKHWKLAVKGFQLYILSVVWPNLCTLQTETTNRESIPMISSGWNTLDTPLGLWWLFCYKD